MIVPIRGRVEGLMPDGDIGYRLIMLTTPLLLATTGVGQYRIRLIVHLVMKIAPFWCDFFYFILPFRISYINDAKTSRVFISALRRQPGSDGYQLSVKCDQVIGFILS